MTKTLILMRHAKSSWSDPVQQDHARPLNGRGRRSATALGTWLRDKQFEPDQALVSTAERTRETFARLKLDCEVTYLDALYHAGAERMLQVLKAATGARVLVLGHNPGIAAFAHDILRETPDHDQFFGYPTGATLVAEFDIDAWAALRPGSGRVRAFVIPRELAD